MTKKEIHSSEILNYLNKSINIDVETKDFTNNFVFNFGNKSLKLCINNNSDIPSIKVYLHKDSCDFLIAVIEDFHDILRVLSYNNLDSEEPTFIGEVN